MIVGVTRTVTVEILEVGVEGGVMEMSGRFTTESEPRERGCSGSQIVEIRS